MIRNAVIFAAGKGSRMNCPSKAMINVSGKPLISYAIDALIKNNIKKIIIIYRSDDEEIHTISSYYDDPKIQFVFIEDTLKKGSVEAHRLFSENVSYPLITLDCDIIVIPFTLKSVIENFELMFLNSKIKAAVAVIDNPIINEEKTLRLVDNIVVEYNKSGFEDGIEGGYIYIWKESLITAIDDYNVRRLNHQEYNSFFSYYISQNKVCAIHVDYLWDVDNRETLSKTEEILDNHILWP